MVLQRRLQRHEGWAVGKIGEHVPRVRPAAELITKHVEALLDAKDVAPPQQGRDLVAGVGILRQRRHQRLVVELLAAHSPSQVSHRLLI